MLALSTTSLVVTLLALAAGVSLGWVVDQLLKQRKRGGARSPLVLPVAGLAVAIIVAAVSLSLSTSSKTTAAAGTSITLCTALNDANGFAQTHHSSLVQIQQSLSYSNQVFGQIAPVPAAVAAPVSTVRTAGAELLAIVTKWIATVRQTPTQKAHTQAVLNLWRPAQQKLSTWYQANCKASPSKG